MADLDMMDKLLSESCREMTRWDVYEAEVDSRHLQWSIIHTEKFFRENARRMEGADGKFSIVKVRVVERYPICECGSGAPPAQCRLVYRSHFSIWRWAVTKKLLQLRALILGSLFGTTRTVEHSQSGLG